VGAGQNGGIKLPTGLPARLIADLLRIGHEVFTSGYVDAMRATMLMPVILLAVGALSCLLLTGPRPAATAPAAPELAVEQGTAA